MLTREKQMNAQSDRAVTQGPLRGPVEVSRGAHSYPVDQVNDPIDYVFVQSSAFRQVVSESGDSERSMTAFPCGFNGSTQHFNLFGKMERLR